MSAIDYFEKFKKDIINIDAGDKKSFSYASKTSIHSEVTDWAYGTPEERTCYDISDGKEIGGKINVEDNEKRFFLKVVACMPKWLDYVLPFTVKINGEIVYDNKETFFEQVNLGWPALYIALPSGALKKGENKVTVAAGGGLYLSELSLVSFPAYKELTQISVRKYVKSGETFGVAFVDGEKKFNKVENVDGCEFIGKTFYKNLCVLTFNATRAGQTRCTVNFGDTSVIAEMPVAVDSDDFFITGIDSDDHRHDDSDETMFFAETAVLSGMGNYVQFRPQEGRNYYKLADEKTFEDFIGLLSAFGMKYGLCDCNSVMGYLPDVNPKSFYGYHIHEPYLFFNPALLENPYEKERFLCDPEKTNAAKTFEDSKKLYFNTLSRSMSLFSKDKGLTSFGSPSLLCVYEGDSAADRITIEPVSNINLLTGAVRASAVKIWGAHVPTDWYFGVPVDRVKSNKHRLAMQYLYLNGAAYVYAENSVFKTNAFKRCDLESEFCTTNRAYQREFYEYTVTHPRKGDLIVDKAIVYGRNEYFLWKLNDRIAELKERDWDSKVWGKWDNNAYQIAWNASEAWLPASDKQNVFESPLNKKIFSGTPYGNVDVVYAEKDFSKYSQIAFLGWNTMDDTLLGRLKDYVYNGGVLFISYAHFNYTDVIDGEKVFPKNEDISEFIGLSIEGDATAGVSARFNDGTVLETSGAAKLVVGKTCGAEKICSDENGNGIVYVNNYGKGKVYFAAFKDYVETEKDTEVLAHTLTTMGKAGDIICDNANVSFTVRETADEYNVSVLNMNCFEGLEEAFNITFRGYTVSGKVKVGEIFSQSIKK